jgi:predicted methyltransferase
VAKLTAGAKVADVGCGHGWSTVIMSQAAGSDGTALTKS